MNSQPVSVPELVPVFPLPEVVLFPGQLLPLHIFEPRYRAMVSDALADHRCLSIALLRPNFEPHYFTSHAPIHRVVGVGRIVRAQPLTGGKYNILVRGLARAELIEERDGRPYRLARVRMLPPHCNGSPEQRTQLRHELCLALQEAPTIWTEPAEEYARLFAAPLSLGELVDALASRLPLVGELRQRLLAEPESCARASLLLKEIRTLIAASGRRPLKRRGRCQWDFN